MVVRPVAAAVVAAAADGSLSQAIKAAYDAGVMTFDTAEVYGNGHSERIVGNALQNVRDKFVIATKVFLNHLKYQKVMDAYHGSLKILIPTI